MPTRTLQGGRHTLTSLWIVKEQGGTKTSSTPTTSQHKYTFNVAAALPAGAVVTSAKFAASTGTAPFGGTIKIGGRVVSPNSSTNFAVTVTDGMCSVLCTYQAAGTTAYVGSWEGAVVITSATLTVSYTVPSSTGGGGTSGGTGDTGGTGYTGTSTWSGSDRFTSESAPWYIYDKTIDKYYIFDGVVKAEHSLSVKMQETSTTTSSTKNDEQTYVNGAKNEPNKITLDVVMSDVYTDRNDLTNTDEGRSVSAYLVLNDLKRQRRKVDVVTNLVTYLDMLLTGISITQDESCPYGWVGQLTLQEITTTQQQGDGSTSSSGSTTRTPSMIVDFFGVGMV